MVTSVWSCELILKCGCKILSWKWNAILYGIKLKWVVLVIKFEWEWMYGGNGNIKSVYGLCEIWNRNGWLNIWNCLEFWIKYECKCKMHTMLM